MRNHNAWIVTDQTMANGAKPFLSFGFALTTTIVLWAGAGATDSVLAQTAPASSRSNTSPDIKPASDSPARVERAKLEPTRTDTGGADAVKLGALPDDPMAVETQASVRKYCVNIAAAATDARFTWQSKKLLELETKIKARVIELDAKQAELKRWYEKREAINKEAKDSLVGIYAKMKPEVAAAQISALDDDMAVAVLAALSPGKAGAIFTEITPTDRAAKLAGLLANPSANPSEKKL